MCIRDRLVGMSKHRNLHAAILCLIDQTLRPNRYAIKMTVGQKLSLIHIFEKFGAYECRQMPDGMDFDYVIYFTDSSIDAYDYCIREEMGHTIYHRFARADFEALMTIQ